MASGKDVAFALRIAVQNHYESHRLLADAPEVEAGIKLFLAIGLCEADWDENADNHYDAKAGHYCGDCKGCFGVWQFCNTNSEYANVRGKGLQAQADAAFRASNGFTNTQPWVASQKCWSNLSGAKKQKLDEAWSEYTSSALGEVVDITFGPLTDPLDAIFAVFEALGKIATWLLDPANWKRVGLVTLGGMVAFLGLFLVNRDSTGSLARATLGRIGGKATKAAAKTTAAAEAAVT